MSKATFRFLVEHVRGTFTVLGNKDPPSAPLVLYALAGCEGEPTVSELADAAGISLKTASRTLIVLGKQGWVALKEDPQDSRMKRVTLTQAGESATAMIASSFEHAARTVVAHAARLRHRRTKGLAAAAALVTLQIAAGLTLGSYVKHVLGNDWLITTTDALSDYGPGAVA